MFISAISTLHMDNQLAKHCSGTVNFRLLVREKAKIHRSHRSGLVVDIHTMWFNSIVLPLHGFCVCMDVSMTSNLKFTVWANTVLCKLVGTLKVLASSTCSN